MYSSSVAFRLIGIAFDGGGSLSGAGKSPLYVRRFEERRTVARLALPDDRRLSTRRKFLERLPLDRLFDRRGDQDLRRAGMFVCYQ